MVTYAASGTTARLTMDTQIYSLTGSASSRYTIKVQMTGEIYTVTVRGTDTMAEMLTQLAAYGIEGSIYEGRLTLSGNRNAYIYTMDSHLSTRLHLRVGEDYTYTTEPSTTYATTGILYSSISSAMTTDTKLSEITGRITSMYITVVTDGTSHVVTVRGSDTVADMLTQLASYDINGSVYNGRLTLQGNEHA